MRSERKGCLRNFGNTESGWFPAENIREEMPCFSGKMRQEVNDLYKNHSCFKEGEILWKD